MSRSKQTGFTIVELLIVIVVIGILAAITLVAYNGVTNRANQASAQSAAEQAAKKVLAYMALNSDQVPVDLTTAGASNNGATTFQYSINANASPQQFCITATTGNVSYFVNNTTQINPATGACPGHGVNGVAAITNYASDPDAVSSANHFGFSGTPASRTFSIATDMAYRGSSSFKVVATGSGQLGADAVIPTHALIVPANTKMSWSFWVYSTKAGSITPYSDGAKVSDDTQAGCNGGSAVAVAANVWTQIKATCTFSQDTYVSKAGGYALAVVPGDTLWADQFMVTISSTPQNYADGNSDNWVWNGTPNASTSTGPAL